MVGRRDHRGAEKLDGDRLDTPGSVGFRSGMSAANLIGRRLALVYGVGGDMPRDIGTLIRTLDERGSR